MNTSAQLDKILPKLAAVKAQLGVIMKKESNPFFKSKYADLNTHIEAVEPLLQKNGLVMFQPCNNSFVETIIFDVESGQYVASQLAIVLSKQDMQQMGSAVSYCRRYTLGALLAMRAEDDDGNRAADHPTKEKVPSAVAETSAVVTNAVNVARPSFRKKAAEAKAKEPNGAAKSDDDI